ncbi:hypothetical protein FJT64_009781 [Amphibalanus amphitrite]|uniref:Uncharacterized protein n=1 Tax=Amphibalanus amphitrite TaxID=1232801 RepID=A0A6A4VSD6_AMPAM|nr:hypothetical protein FJT64_009781 [Amphibalanus amphitrite]
MPTVDLDTIEDEVLLRKMWKEEEDVTEKRNIRARMFQLRERRLKDLHGSDDGERSLERDSRYRRLAGEAADSSERASSPPRKEASPPRKEASPVRKEASPVRKEMSPGRKEMSPETEKTRSRRSPASESRGSSPRKTYSSRAATTEVPARKSATPERSGPTDRRARRAISTVEPPAGRPARASPTRKQRIDIVNKPEKRSCGDRRRPDRH